MTAWSTTQPEGRPLRHPGRRRRHPALPAHQGPRQAGGPAGRASTGSWTSRSATASTPTSGGSSCSPSSTAARCTATSRRATASTTSRPGSSRSWRRSSAPSSESWYQGTADAVRQNLVHLGDYPHRLVLILSGDQLYRMNFRALLEQHVASGAEVTVATTPVRPRGRRRVRHHGAWIRRAGSSASSRSRRDPAVQRSLRVDWRGSRAGEPVDPDALPASMGIYVFDRDVLAEALAGSEADFGKHVIPRHHRDPPGARLPVPGLLGGHRHHPLLLRGQPRPLRAAAASSTSTTPPRRSSPTRATCPATKIIKSRIERSVIADGCIINDALIEHSLVGVRSRIQAGATIRDSLVMGAGLLRDPRPRAPAGRAADRDRPGRVDRAGHRGQERPDRRLGAHHARGQAGPVRRRPTSTSATASWWSPRTR